MAKRVGEKTELLMKNKELSEQLREMTEYSESPKINRLIEKHVAIEDFDYFEDSKFRKYI